MGKKIHEIRDPIHVFVRMSTDEREIVDSAPFQRLRHIHQLALTYLVYPGATHKRFEHSIGVMELASRVFDVITHEDAVRGEIRESIKEIGDKDKLRYWRQVLRIAALCHDLGHLPFSHAAEKDLLPEGWDHERLTMEILRSDFMRPLWINYTPPLNEEHIIKLAIGPKKAKGYKFSIWEAILSEIIVGDSFGVDRMDYLLRDSYHTGVAYGKFDHYRLIDTLRILPSVPLQEQEQSFEPALGIEEGGLQSVEALLLARYFMFSQVYFHPVRRIYDIHLKDFLKEWLENGYLSTKVDEILEKTDNEVTSALRESAAHSNQPGHEHAKKIICRAHYKVFYERNPNDIRKNPEASRKIFETAREKFGEVNIRYDNYSQKGGLPDFPVLRRDKTIVSSLSLSETLKHIPIVSFDYVFIKPELRDEAKDWLKRNREDIIKPDMEVEE